jgi:hypothetical protein
MNAMTDVIVCADRIRAKLVADMRLLQNDRMRKKVEEKIAALNALYKTHMYVAGEFSSAKNMYGEEKLFFKGSICDVAYDINLL